VILSDELVARHLLVVDVASGLVSEFRVAIVGIVRVLCRGGWLAGLRLA